MLWSSHYSQSKRVGSETGQATVMVTAGLVFLFGILGLVVDVGYSYFLKQQTQAVADSAALAGAIMAKSSIGTCNTTVLCQSATVCPNNPTNPPLTTFDDACLYAKRNGAAQEQVTVSAGTGSTPNNAVNIGYWMNVTVSQNTPMTFTRVLGFNGMNVASQATAGLKDTGASDGCIWVLDPVGAQAFNATGTSNFQSNCTINVNSSASNGFRVQGGGVVKAASISVVGGAVMANNTTVSPAPTIGASPVQDPLASLPAPTYSGCDQTNFQPGGGTFTLQPGVYCGGIKVSAQAVLNFSPGTYILNGGGLDITSNQATLNGSGVFFYNTANGFAFNPITIASGASVNFTAPTSGTYKGVMMFQDRSILSSATSAIGGGANQTYTGTIYMPNGNLSYSGGSSTNSLTVALVVADLTIVGNAYMAKDSSGESTGISQNIVSLIQ